MRPESGPGLVDVLVVILSPVIVAALTLIYLVGWWSAAAWRAGRVRGNDERFGG